jgi:uncharacterized membrane protein
VAGGLLWFTVGKDASFYSSNPIFHIKVTLFFIAGGLSIYPTLFFCSSSQARKQSGSDPEKGHHARTHSTADFIAHTTVSGVDGKWYWTQGLI